MFDFSKYLKEDEEILYQGKPTPVSGKGNSNNQGLIFLILYCLAIQIILILSIVYKIGDGANGINFSFIVIFLVILLFELLGIYGLLDNLFLKKKRLVGIYYCVTNKRVLEYEQKKDKLVYGYLINYEEIKCANMKNGYGDLCMSAKLDKEGDLSMMEVKDIILHPNYENMPSIIFESIKSPKEVSKIVINARKNLLEQINGSRASRLH